MQQQTQSDSLNCLAVIWDVDGSSLLCTHHMEFLRTCIKDFSTFVMLARLLN
jgi:hypothetical protein